MNGGHGTPLSLPLCDWCRAELADGWLDDSPACLNCADGLLVGDGLPLAAQLAIEERSRTPRLREAPYEPTEEDYLEMHRRLQEGKR